MAAGGPIPQLLMQTDRLQLTARSALPFGSTPNLNPPSPVCQLRHLLVP